VRLLALVLSTSSCAGWSPPPELLRDLRRVDLSLPAFLYEPTLEIQVDGERLFIESQLKKSQSAWPRDTYLYEHQTVISFGSDWWIRCFSLQRVEGGVRADAIFFTTSLNTTCSTEGAPPLVELMMESWPRVEGLVTVDSREYRIRATDEHRTKPAALIVTHASEVVLMVDNLDRIWMRADLDEYQRRMLARVAAVLWSSVELRAN
jgi:hypothetical protein